MGACCFSNIKTFLLAVSALTLIACGGGGGPGGGNSLSLSISSTTMNLIANKTDPAPASPVITLTASGGTVYIDSDGTINGIYGHGVYCSNSNTCTVEVQPRPPASLNAGTHVDTINIRGCSDNLCNSVFVTYTITVTYVISEGGGFTTSPASLAFNSVNNIAPAPQVVTVSYAGGVATSWAASVSYTSGNNWLTLSPSGGSASAPVDITVSPQGLPTGTYNATIYVTSNGGTITTSIPVSFTVIAARTSPEQLSFNVDLASQSADLEQVLTVLDNFAGANASADWSISADVNWLLFSQASGDTLTQNTVTVTVDSNEISNLRNGTHTGLITLASTTLGVDDWTVPVTLVVDLPQVNYVAPYTVYSGAAGGVIVRGSGFSGLTTENVMFGANSATSVNVISDTELFVEHAALAAGVYAVEIENTLGIAMSRADLHVLDPVSFSEASIPTSGSDKYRLVYDAQRQTLYAATFSQIQRYRMQSGSWVADSLAITNLNDIAMTPDGRELIALGSPTVSLGASQIYHVDLDNFAITAQTSYNFTDYINSNSTFIGANVLSLAMANDGHALIGSANLSNGYLKYNLLTRTLQFLSTVGNGGLTRPAIAGAADGSRLFLAGGNGPQAQYVFMYDASGDGTLQVSSVGDSTQYVTTDNTGSRVILDRNLVYDGQMVYLGTYPAATASALSGNGNIAYGFLSGSGVIRLYNLASPNGTGGFNSGGADITLANNPGGTGTRMILTPGDMNAFIGGNTSIVVVPLP